MYMYSANQSQLYKHSRVTRECFASDSRVTREWSTSPLCVSCRPTREYEAHPSLMSGRRIDNMYIDIDLPIICLVFVQYSSIRYLVIFSSIHFVSKERFYSSHNATIGHRNKETSCRA